MKNIYNMLKCYDIQMIINELIIDDIVSWKNVCKINYDIIYRCYLPNYRKVCTKLYNIVGIICDENTRTNEFHRVKNLEFADCRFSKCVTYSWNKKHPNLLTLKTNDKIENYHFKNFNNLRCLDIEQSIYLSNDGIKDLHNLEELKLGRNDAFYFGGITDNGIINLKNLKRFDCKKNNRISDACIKDKIKLKELVANRMLTNDCLYNLVNLTSLDISVNEMMDDNGIKYFLNLAKLICNLKITNEGIRLLKNLTYLDLNKNRRITDYGICTLTKMKTIYIYDRMSEFGIMNMVDLEELHICGESRVNIYCLDKCNKLKTINVCDNIFIFSNPMHTFNFFFLAKLEYLHVENNEYLNDEHLYYLKNLKSFVCYSNANVTDNGIRYLANLENLQLINYETMQENKKITDKSVSLLVNLKYLSVNSVLTNDALMPLIHLECLQLYSNELIDNNGIKHLIHMRELNCNENITELGIINMRYLEDIGHIYRPHITIPILKKLVHLRTLNDINIRGFTEKKISEII